MRIALTYNEKRSASIAEAEFDSSETIAQLAGILCSLGHDVIPIDVTGSIPRLCERLGRAAPDLVFNIAEGERGRFREAFYPALFEQLGLPHTGSSASTLAMCLDKALAKRIVAAAGVAVAEGVFLRNADDWRSIDADWLEGPLIVKPNFEGASKGITASSLSTSKAQLPAIVETMLREYPDGILVERFVDGIDVSVPWVEGIGWLPSIAYRYAASEHAIYDYALKHVEQSRVTPETPARLDELTAKRLAVEARRTFVALDIAGLGRADFRISSRGDIVFLEMNPLPSLGDGELFASAGQLGIAPREVLRAVVAAVTTTREIRQPHSR